MATTRFNVFIFKALSNTAIYSPSLSTRTFIQQPATNKTKSATKTTKTKKTSTKKADKKSGTKAKPKPKPEKVAKLTKKEEKLLKQHPDPNLPQRPTTVYCRFIKHYHQNNNISLNPSTMSTISKQTASAWRNLSDSDKAVYSQQYATERDQYKQFMEQYKANNKQQTWLDKLNRLIGTMPARNGYQAFIKKKVPKAREKNPLITPPQRLSNVAKSWSKLSREEKQTWSEKAKKAYADWEKKK
eukprot:74904_1